MKIVVENKGNTNLNWEDVPNGSLIISDKFDHYGPMIKIESRQMTNGTGHLLAVSLSGNYHITLEDLKTNFRLLSKVTIEQD